MSQLCTEELQEDNNEECSSHDAGLNSIFRLGAGLGCPVELDVSNDKATWCRTC